MRHPSASSGAKRSWWKDSGLGFSLWTLWLHWISLILFVLWQMTGLLSALTKEAGARGEYLEWHWSLGIVLSLIASLRLYRRISQHHPLPLGGVNPPQVIAARLISLAMLMALIALPVLAWVEASASGRTVLLVGQIPLPQLVPANHSLATAADGLYLTVLALFTLSLLLHVFGAFKHHFTLKDDTLRRIFGKQVEL